MDRVAPVTISQADTEVSSDGRFDRFKLISWWDQSRLSSANVLVVGAGALGNELVKNLALLGIGQVLVADMDHVENSNLSRSVLFREKNNGQPKAQVAAAAAKDLYPDIRIESFCGNIVHDLGLGVYRWADVILGGLDNREARLAINRACYKVNRPWIDGAIEQIQGLVRVFSPPGPCYECTMSEMDWKLLQMRRSCNLLSRSQMVEGKTPTTPTISAIVAGVQAQEAVKLLHGLESIQGNGWVFNGLTTEAYTVAYPQKEECYSHDTLDEIISLDEGVADLTASDLIARATKLMGEEVELELAREMLQSLVCPKCHQEEEWFTSLGKVTEAQAACPGCGHELREVKTFFKICGDESFVNRTLASIGVPAFDIVVARSRGVAGGIAGGASGGASGVRSLGFEFTGDAALVLGSLVQTQEQIEWS